MRRFDIEHVLAAIAPRPFLAMSGTDDKYADELVALARPAYHSSRAGAVLSHLHVTGGHGLDDERFTAIVHWMTATGSPLQSRSCAAASPSKAR